MARSTFYDEGLAEGTATAALLERMRAIQDEFPAYGYRRITAQLHAVGVPVNRKRVARLMRRHGMQVRPRRRFGATTDHRKGACTIRTVAASTPPGATASGQGSVPVLGPEDLSHNDMAQIMSEVLGKTVRFQQIPAESIRPRLKSSGYFGAMAQAMIDMLVAESEGLDNAARRTPRSTIPTSFRQWCEEVLGPAVLHVDRQPL